MANELVKKGNMLKTGTILTLAGSIASFIFVHWILGAILLVCTAGLGWKLMKNYAATGRRF